MAARLTYGPKASLASARILVLQERTPREEGAETPVKIKWTPDPRPSNWIVPHQVHPLVTSPSNSWFCWCPPQCVSCINLVLMASNTARALGLVHCDVEFHGSRGASECDVNGLVEVLSYNGKTLLCFRQTTAFLMRGVAKQCFL